MDIFSELSLIIVVTAIVAGIMRLFKQPLVIGYIITGFILAPFLFSTEGSREAFAVFSEMGIAILLFIVGLHLSPLEITEYGKSSLLIGLFQVLFTSALGFFLSLFLGFSTIESVYFSIAVSLSSTIIVLKLLSDKKDLEKLYGRLAIGILLIQDILASIALIFVSAAGKENTSAFTFLTLSLKGALLVSFVYLIGNYVLPKFGKFFARSQEYLLLFSLAWGFGLASLFNLLGFSIEIGALMAGVALSISPYSHEISARLRPLRDFFVVMFFVSLGTQVVFKNLNNLWVAVFVLTAFVLIIKPLIVMILLKVFKYNTKTIFYEGLSLGQISEFSLILILLGVRSGHVGEGAFAVIIMSGVLSIAVSSYLIVYTEKIYPVFAQYFRFVEKRSVLKERSIVTNYEVILFGCNRIGYDFVRTFQHLGPAFLVVDYDPDVINVLEKDRINCMYGDAEDGEFLDDINVSLAKIVISTVPDFDANAFLLQKLESDGFEGLSIALSYNIDEALKLYELGASYVILPHFISGEYAADIALKAGTNHDEVHKRRKEHVDYLKKRKSVGHSHPTWSHNL